MAMKYSKRNVPMVVIDNLRKKQKEMERQLEMIIGKKKSIPLTKVMIAVSQKPTFLTEDELKKMSKRRIFRV